MSVYSVVLFGHVAGVIVIFMSTAVELLSLHRMRGATSTDQLREWSSLTKTTAMLFPLGGAAMVVSGLYMALTVWGLSVPWIALSLAVVAVMSVFGPAVNSRRLEAIAAVVKTEAPGPIAPALARRVHDRLLLASVHALAALAFAVVFLKVVRPDLTTSLVVLSLAVAGGLLTAYLASRGERVPATAKPVRAVAGERL